MDNTRVMVVDDDPDILFTVKAVLESSGLSVITVNSGRDCLVELTKGFAGLLLVDVMMPEMDGWQTIKAIVDGGYAGKVIICMLTAKHLPDREMEQLTEYVLEYIRKPFEADELVATVNNYLSYLK